MTRPSGRAPRAGGAEHTLPLRVYYEDTDAGGVVYHATYLRFAERGRTEFLRARGFEHERLLAEHGLVFTVRHCVVDYRRPARLDDALILRTRVAGLAGASFVLQQTVERAGEALVRLDVRLALIDRQGRPARLPGRLKQELSAAAALTGDGS